jgi:outer membrane protein OmpA-like peptidoglycan-associated protein
MKRLLLSVGLLLCFALAAPAAAQEGALQIEQFEPLPGATSILGRPTSSVLDHLHLDVELWGNFSDRPLTLTPAFEGDPREGGVVVPSRFRTEVLVAFGLLDFAQASFSFPFTTTTGQSELGLGGRTTEELTGTFAGDARFGVDFDVLALIRRAARASDPGWGPGVSLGVTTWFPTGSTVAFEGEGGVRVEPRLALDFTAPFGLRVAGGIGYHVRPASRVFNYRNEDTVRWSAGVSSPIVLSGLEAMLAVSGTVQTVKQSDPGVPNTVVQMPSYDPVELMGGLRVRTPIGLHFGVGAGGPLNAGVGAPVFRIVGFVGWDIDLKPDRSGPDVDGDGLDYAADLCPYEAEIFDGVRDADGCPEADALRWGGPPSEAPAIEPGVVQEGEVEEDPVIRGSELPERSGMAELPALTPLVDSDGDGLYDRQDLCPEQAEDVDGFADDDGCPDPDDDGDGVLDAADACPRDAESPNGFDDEDGCPDIGPDEDEDLVGDAFDLCPLEPENRDGVRDQDGCPEAGEDDIARWSAVVEAASSGGAAPEPVPEAELVRPDALPPLPVYPDRDDDGVPDPFDDCPDAAEDPDGFADGDGCPDEDNDGDGLVDAEDRCPLDAESVNEVIDGDGCPDAPGDLDGDGIGDVLDGCPLEPETVNGVRDGDGCPEDPVALALAREQVELLAEPPPVPQAPTLADEPPAPLEPPVELPPLQQRTDADGDGLFADEDLCPDAAEDVDGLADEDGCPDPDVDGDGVLDESDLCPLDAESPNGFEDADGCPEIGPDQDGDDVEDFHDLCPYEPESLDGQADFDGCPEADDVVLDQLVQVAPTPSSPSEEPKEAVVADLASLLPPLSQPVDSDLDGVADRFDACPTRPEDLDGFDDGDGCPDPDNDGDGLVDARDRCPDAAEIVNGVNDDDGCPDRGMDADDDYVDDVSDLCPWEPEDMDGVRDWDGCPEEAWAARPAAMAEEPVAVVMPVAVTPATPAPVAQADEVGPAELLLPPLPVGHDADGDGFAAWEDDCPYQAEDQDGFDDGDGCPDLDDDGDGVPDARDACQWDAETVNSYEDDDGCPDKVPVPVVAVSGIVRGIRFASGSARLTRDSYPKVQQVADALLADPGLRLVVAGHTDSVGDHARNVELSHERAQAVTDRLVAAGVPAAHLEVHGYGPDQPLQSNETSAGRAANRRVELIYSRVDESPEETP